MRKEIYNTNLVVEDDGPLCSVTCTKVSSLAGSGLNLFSGGGSVSLLLTEESVLSAPKKSVIVFL